MDTFLDVQFYDYTKCAQRVRTNDCSNYYLLFSRGSKNDRQCDTMLRNGHNVVVVFEGALPSQYRGVDVVDGDLSDLRFLDPTPRVVGLRAKGDAVRDTSGFVVR